EVSSRFLSLRACTPAVQSTGSPTTRWTRWRVPESRCCRCRRRARAWHDRGVVREGERSVAIGGGPDEGAVSAAIVTAWHDVDPEDIAGWFRDRAAYALQP